MWVFFVEDFLLTLHEGKFKDGRDYISMCTNMRIKVYCLHMRG